MATGVVVAGLAAFAVFAVQAGLDWMWESTACAVLGLAAAGCAVAASRPAAGRRPGASGFARRWPSSPCWRSPSSCRRSSR